jgi:hypothetical protein
MIKEGYMVFDNRYIRHRFENGPISLLTNDALTIRHYANCVSMVQIIDGYYYGYLLRQKELGMELISLIKKQYDLK